MKKIVEADECTMLGITIPCMKGFGEQQIDTYGFELATSHLWTFGLTVAIGIYNLTMINCKAPKKSGENDRPYHWSFMNSGHTMTITTGGYAIITGFFALFRFYWGVSKPLLITAALHNLFEWFIVVMIAEKSNNRKALRKGFVTSFYWIGFIISVSLIIPNLFYAFAVEQSFGIVLDMLLPIMHISKFVFAEDAQVRRFFFLPALAHTIHLFGTILPLVFAIFWIDNPSIFSDLILECVINVSVPMSHGLYCLWG
jgi:hypothetical protein